MPAVLDSRDKTGPINTGLTGRDRVAIHIPGSIQPHGILLVADADTRAVVAGAGPIETLFAPAWLGRALADLLGTKIASALDAISTSTGVALGCAHGMTGPFEVVAHRVGDRLLIELEPAPLDAPSAVEVFSELEAVTTIFERSTDLADLCDRAADIFQRMTGFDRVMVYRFLDDDAGVVVSEAGNGTLGSFLNQHFPAADIPKQARALFVRNRLRVIPDVDYQPAPLRPKSPVTADLDMTDVALRGIYPLHLQYLRNMGVAASATISIVKDGALWGMLACHNATPRLLPNHVRFVCRSLAGSLAQAIKTKEDADSYRARIRLRGAEDAILLKLGSDVSLTEFSAARATTCTGCSARTASRRCGVPIPTSSAERRRQV